MNDGTKIVLIGLLVVLLLVLFVLSPIFTIWALNLLFHLEIPVNFGTWCAVQWLLIVMKSTVTRKSN